MQKVSQVRLISQNAQPRPASPQVRLTNNPSLAPSTPDFTDQSRKTANTVLARMINRTDMENTVMMFLLNCKSRNLSPKTIDGYQGFLKQFVKFCLGNGLFSPSDIRDYHIEMFLLFKEQEGCCAVTRADYYRHLHKFFNWAVKKKMVPTSPMESMEIPKHEERIIEPFKTSDIIRLLAQCELADTPFEATRDSAIILTFLDTGLRLSELANILLTDIQEDSDCLKVLGKGAKERLVPISPKVMESICRYLIVRKQKFPNCTDSHLWINKLGGHLQNRRIQKMIEEVGDRAGIQGVRCSPHTFRHTFGTMFMINASEVGDPENVARELQTLLGHETPKMTQHYTETAKRRIALKAHKKYSPLKNLGLD